MNFVGCALRDVENIIIPFMADFYVPLPKYSSFPCSRVGMHSEADDELPICIPTREHGNEETRKQKGTIVFSTSLSEPYCRLNRFLERFPYGKPVFVPDNLASFDFVFSFLVEVELKFFGKAAFFLPTYSSIS